MAKTKKKAPPGTTLLVKNRRALHDFEILERFEAGLVLMGSEVKSIRDAKVSLTEAYAQFRTPPGPKNDPRRQGPELYLLGAHIGEYPMAHARNHDPMRPRKLLLHRRELDKLAEAVGPGGLTLVPLSLYLKDGRIKLELGLARGKKAVDKRQSIKERDQKREMARAMRER